MTPIEMYYYSDKVAHEVLTNDSSQKDTIIDQAWEEIKDDEDLYNYDEFKSIIKSMIKNRLSNIGTTYYCTNEPALMPSGEEVDIGYHTREIERGTYGEITKIMEEYEELLDAHEQGNKVMELVELSDLLGAIEGYVKKFNMTLDHLIKMKEATHRAFRNGHRKPR